MGNLTNGADPGAEKRRHAEILLASYPDLSRDELAQLVRWFRKDASSLDMGLLAQHQELGGPYRKFRAEHVDRFTWRDAINGLVMSVAMFGLMAGLVYLAR